MLASQLGSAVDGFLGNDHDFAVSSLAVGVDPFERFGGAETSEAHEDASGLFDEGPGERGCGDSFVDDLLGVDADGVGKFLRRLVFWW